MLPVRLLVTFLDYYSHFFFNFMQNDGRNPSSASECQNLKQLSSQFETAFSSSSILRQISLEDVKGGGRSLRRPVLIFPSSNRLFSSSKFFWQSLIIIIIIIIIIPKSSAPLVQVSRVFSLSLSLEESLQQMVGRLEEICTPALFPSSCLRPASWFVERFPSVFLVCGKRKRQAKREQTAFVG